MTNSEARKRAQEAAEAAENSISRPVSPQPANSPSDALAGAQGVEAIRARVEAATPGPWEAVRVPFRDTASHSIRREKQVLALVGWEREEPVRSPADAEFIAHTRTDIPLLLAALDEARAEARDGLTRADTWRDENDKAHALVTRWRERATAAEAVVASVRELADEWLNEGVSENGSYPIGEVETEDMCARQLRAALTPDPSPAPVAPTAVEPTVVTSGDEASAGEAARCSCGTEATSLNPAEVVVHQTGAPCYIAAATPTTTETGDES